MIKPVDLPMKVATRLQELIQTLPDGFYDSFRFTTTGNNLTHPVTLGLLTSLAADLWPSSVIAIDLRINFGKGNKFQPDVAVLSERLEPLVFFDYESPNSSDARIPEKDVDAYCRWQKMANRDCPYFIITTLANGESPEWELRWCDAGSHNHPFKSRITEMRRNPCAFWYQHYASACAKNNAICLLNIEGKKVQVALGQPTPN